MRSASKMTHSDDEPRGCTHSALGSGACSGEWFATVDVVMLSMRLEQV